MAKSSVLFIIGAVLCYNLIMKSFHYYKPNPSLDRELHDLKTKPASYLEKKGEAMVMKLFQYVYDAVPAYKKWLKKHKVDGSKIKTLADFKTLPLLDKAGYLRGSVYEELFPYRDLTGATTISATSGSTGEPFYFPRGEAHDEQYRYVAEIFSKNQFEIDKHSTLGIVGFGLGIWIGGMFTYKNFNVIVQKGYKLTLAPVGTNKDLFLKTLKKFGHNFDQVILMGYPPFIKDAIDHAAGYGVNLKDYKIRILTAAEGFSERFREHLAAGASLENSYRDIVNIYGTVELGTMAHETALSYLIRHLAHNNKAVAQSLFPNIGTVPTLAQYYPQHAYFEQIKGEVVGTGYGSSIPLLRYRFHDVGGVIKFADMEALLAAQGIDLHKEAVKAGIKDLLLKLPFVYVAERSDNTVILRGANVYASQVRNALDDCALGKFVTGKFTMMKKETWKADGYLEIHLELKDKVKPTTGLKKKILNTIIADLRKYNSEYNDAYAHQSRKATPRIKFWPYQHREHFGAGKQKWVKGAK